MNRPPSHLRGNTVATHLVNMDALIRREDFEAGSQGASQTRRLGVELKLSDLEGHWFHLLRKPDFQRETSSWDAERVADFVKSFLDGDLIPAAIMWWSTQNGSVFVIDGAHRLSALLAWVHDDYGDGDISKKFWQYAIPPAQQKLAVATKRLIEQEVGTYRQLKLVASSSVTPADDAMLRRARNMATFKIDLQWVEGSAKTAEQSFYRINGSASIIDL